MITDYEKIKELLQATYDNPDIEVNEYGLKIKKNKNHYARFKFEDFRDGHGEHCLHEMYVNHLCLTFDYWNKKEQNGGGYMEVCDDRDLSKDIIKFVDTRAKLNLPKREVAYVQLSLFGGVL